MPRSFDFSVDSSATVEQIHLAFAERDYWSARLTTFGGLGSLDSLTIGSDGAVSVVVVKDMHPDGVPGPAAKFFPQRWRVVQHETWRPIGDGRVRGEVSVEPHGAPGSGAGTALLTPTTHGSRLKCTATVEFRVPMIGGAVESVMGRLLVQNISVMQRFTTDWIQAHA